MRTADRPRDGKAGEVSNGVSRHPKTHAMTDRANQGDAGVGLEIAKEGTSKDRGGDPSPDGHRPHRTGRKGGWLARMPVVESGEGMEGCARS